MITFNIYSGDPITTALPPGNKNATAHPDVVLPPEPEVSSIEPELQREPPSESGRDVTNVDIMREVTMLRETVNMLVAERDMEGPSSVSGGVGPPSYHSD